MCCTLVQMDSVLVELPRSRVPMVHGGLIKCFSVQVHRQFANSIFLETEEIFRNTGRFFEP